MHYNLRYSRDQLLKVRDNVYASSGAPEKLSLKNSIKTRSKFSRGRRAGYFHNFKARHVSKMSVPAIASCNARSIFEKTDELGNFLKSGVYKKIGIMCLKEIWLHASIDTSLVTMDGFSTHRADRHGGITRPGDPDRHQVPVPSSEAVDGRSTEAGEILLRRGHPRFELAAALLAPMHWGLGVDHLGMS